MDRHDFAFRDAAKRDVKRTKLRRKIAEMQQEAVRRCGEQHGSKFPSEFLGHNTICVECHVGVVQTYIEALYKIDERIPMPDPDPKDAQLRNWREEALRECIQILKDVLPEGCPDDF